MKLDRESELFLMRLGGKYLLEALGPNHGIDRTVEELGGHAEVWHKSKKVLKKKRKHNGHKWTAQQRRRFRMTMKKLWKQKRAEQKEK